MKEVLSLTLYAKTCIEGLPNQLINLYKGPLMSALAPGYDAYIVYLVKDAMHLKLKQGELEKNAGNKTAEAKPDFIVDGRVLFNELRDAGIQSFPTDCTMLREAFIFTLETLKDKKLKVLDDRSAFVHAIGAFALFAVSVPQNDATIAMLKTVLLKEAYVLSGKSESALRNIQSTFGSHEKDAAKNLSKKEDKEHRESSLVTTDPHHILMLMASKAFWSCVDVSFSTTPEKHANAKHRIKRNKVVMAKFLDAMVTKEYTTDTQWMHMSAIELSNVFEHYAAMIDRDFDPSEHVVNATEEQVSV